MNGVPELRLQYLQSTESRRFPRHVRELRGGVLVAMRKNAKRLVRFLGLFAQRAAARPASLPLQHGHASTQFELMAPRCSFTEARRFPRQDREFRGELLLAAGLHAKNAKTNLRFVSLFAKRTALAQPPFDSLTTRQRGSGFDASVYLHNGNH